MNKIMQPAQGPLMLAPRLVKGQYRIYVGSRCGYMNVEIEGWFHGFFQDAEECENGTINWPIALVEFRSMEDKVEALDRYVKEAEKSLMDISKASFVTFHDFNPQTGQILEIYPKYLRFISED